MKRSRNDFCYEDRYQYLKELLHEFQVSQNQDSKKQVLANLANFCYDPINYDHLRKLNLICIFLDLLSVRNTKFVEFSIAGLCNLSCDAKNIEIIINYMGIEKICYCIDSDNIDIKLSSLTALINLSNNSSTALEAIKNNTEFKQKLNTLRGHKNQRIINLAIILYEKLA